MATHPAHVDDDLAPFRGEDGLVRWSLFYRWRISETLESLAGAEPGSTTVDRLEKQLERYADRLAGAEREELAAEVDPSATPHALASRALALLALHAARVVAAAPSEAREAHRALGAALEAARG